MGEQRGDRGHEKRGRWLWLADLLLAVSIAVLGISLFLFVFGAELLPATWFANLVTEASTLARRVAQALLQQLTIHALLLGGLSFAAAFGLLAWSYSRPLRG